MWEQLLIDYLCALLIVIIIIKYIDIFFEPKENNKIYLLCSALGSLVIPQLAYEIWGIPILNFTLSLLGIFAICCAFEGSVGKKILITFSVAMLNAACDMIAYTILLPVSGQEGNINISCLFMVLLILMCEQIVRRVVGKQKNAYKYIGTSAILILIPLCSLGIIYFVTEMSMNGWQTMMIALCVMIINLIVFYLYQKNIENYLTHIQCEILEERSRAYANELELMTKTQRKMQALQHDLKHHILELKGMAQENKTGEISTYLENMEQALNISKEYVRSGNYHIDSLLNYLLDEANERLDEVKTAVKIPENANLNTFKLNIILGNLLENAIEAAERSDKKQLRMEMTLEKGVLLIQMANTYQGELQKKGDDFVTTKEDKHNHGIGLKNVKELVEEENGTVTITTDDGWFMADVLLYVE